MDPEVPHVVAGEEIGPEAIWSPNLATLRGDRYLFLQGSRTISTSRSSGICSCGIDAEIRQYSDQAGGT